jgi:hypothetical protein
VFRRNLPRRSETAQSPSFAVSCTEFSASVVTSRHA